MYGRRGCLHSSAAVIMFKILREEGDVPIYLYIVVHLILIKLTLMPTAGTQSLANSAVATPSIKS